MSASEPPAACPPPLLWQDVRREYLAQSTERVIGSVSVRILGAGPPLYFLPGFSAPAELYCLMIWLLRDDFRCVTIEPLKPGLGSGKPGLSIGAESPADQSLSRALSNESAVERSSPYPNRPFKMADRVGVAPGEPL
jgi:hypothetical protein